MDPNSFGKHPHIAAFILKGVLKHDIYNYMEFVRVSFR